MLTGETNAASQVLGRVFDNEDRPTSVTDANGVTVTQTFDSLGRVLSRTCPDNGVEHFGYVWSGLAAYRNQVGNTNGRVYDAAGRVTTQYSGKGETVQYTYDAGSDLLKLLDRKNQATTWGYDVYGRATSKTNAAGAQILTYAYDALNRATNMVDGVGTTIYVFAFSRPEARKQLAFLWKAWYGWGGWRHGSGRSGVPGGGQPGAGIVGRGCHVRS